MRKVIEAFMPALFGLLIAGSLFQLELTRAGVTTSWGLLALAWGLFFVARRLLRRGTTK